MVLTPRFRTVCIGLAFLLLPAFARADETPVDFERQVMGLFGRMGCNAGSCHGSFQGRGGFRLSLFGYDPAKDYLAVSRENEGRRINRSSPALSLLLLKPTTQVSHGGGKRFAKDSWQYRLLYDWIAQGAKWSPGSGSVAAMTVVPAEHRFKGTMANQSLAVRVRFADGNEEDVTRFCDFRTNNDAVAQVDSGGLVTAAGPGDTAIVVSYRGNVRAARILIPATLPHGSTYPLIAADGYIDREVFAKLRDLDIVPSDQAGDEEFLRRITIDTIASLPSPAETRAFLADKDPDKRGKKVDRLLTHPLHAALWAAKLSDVTGNNTDALEQPRDLQPRRSQMWFDWLRKRLAEDVPYDRIVHDILCATSRDGQSPEAWLKQVRAEDEALQKGFAIGYADKPSLDLYWRRQGNVNLEQWGERAAAAFLGVRLECAQCHKHPFDRWTQADYRSFANIFGQVSVGASVEAKRLIDAENNRRKDVPAAKKNQTALVREVFLTPKSRLLTDPDTRRFLSPQALGGPKFQTARGEDCRELFFAWLCSPDNPYFARSFVNRVWAHYFGVGIVHPVDDFSVANPPSNSRLLDALARDFVEHGYDLRRLEATILRSRVYQLSAKTNASNRLDRNNYSHAYIRPLMAEAVVDICDAALGVSQRPSPDAPAGSRAIEIGSSRVQGPLAYAFRIFGRPPRSSTCDCERPLQPALPQTLYRMTDATLLAKMERGRLGTLLKGKWTDQQILEELFLATLSRRPTAEEKDAYASHRSQSRNRQAALTDTLWALINTREFILNH
jgi:hypothetical protein